MKRQFYTKREDGTASPYRNIEYLPAFFFIPKELLDRCPSDLRNLSRVPWEYFTNRKLIQLVESDLFLELITPHWNRSARFWSEPYRWLCGGSIYSQS